MADVGPFGDASPYGKFTTTKPVAKLWKTDQTNPLHVYFTPPEFAKLNVGDKIKISYTDQVMGRSMLENKTFTLGTANAGSFNFILLENGAQIDGRAKAFVVTGGFAEVL